MGDNTRPKGYNNPDQGNEQKFVTMFFEWEGLMANIKIVQSVQKETEIQNTTHSGAVKVYLLKINGWMNFRYNTNEELCEAYQSLKDKLESVGVVFI